MKNTATKKAPTLSSWS